MSWEGKLVTHWIIMKVELGMSTCSSFVLDLQGHSDRMSKVRMLFHKKKISFFPAILSQELAANLPSSGSIKITKSEMWRNCQAKKKKYSALEFLHALFTTGEMHCQGLPNSFCHLVQLVPLRGRFISQAFNITEFGFILGAFYQQIWPEMTNRKMFSRRPTSVWAVKK